MIAYWQQYFFRDVIEKRALRKGMMPVIDEEEADDLPEGAEPLEEFEDDGEPREVLACDLPDDEEGGAENE